MNGKQQLELPSRKGGSRRVLYEYLGDAFFDELERLIREGGYGELHLTLKPGTPLALTVIQSLRGTQPQPVIRRNTKKIDNERS